MMLQKAFFAKNMWEIFIIGDVLHYCCHNMPGLLQDEIDLDIKKI